MSTASATMVDQQSDLIGQLAALLQQHPLGESFKLLYTPHGLPLAEDEVLVQKVDAERHVMELHPTALSDILLGDVMHDTQIVNPQDRALTGYAQARSSDNCRVHQGRHYYMM